MRGIWYVLSTPFSRDREVDEDSLRALVESSTRWGVDGLVALAVMSEVAALDEGERSRVMDLVFTSAAGRLPVVVGCSGSSPHVVTERMAKAQDRGAHAAMVASPPLLGDVDSLPRFYERVARRGLPVVIQDDPRSTGVRIPTRVLIECVDRADPLAIKLEDPPTPAKIAELVNARPNVAVFGGLGGVAGLMELARGAAGLMTGFAFPEILTALFAAWTGGDRRMAAAIFDRYLPLISLEGQIGIGLGIRKEALKLRGIIRDATVRVPDGTIDDATRQELLDFIARAGLAMGPGPISIATTREDGADSTAP